MQTYGGLSFSSPAIVPFFKSLTAIPLKLNPILSPAKPYSNFSWCYSIDLTSAVLSPGANANTSPIFNTPVSIRPEATVPTPSILNIS